MSANIWSPGSEVIVTGNNSLAVQNFDAAPGQTVFILTAFSYVLGQNSLSVYYNGVYQRLNIDYSETATDRITFLSSPFVTGDTVTIVGNVEVTLAVSAPLSDSLPADAGTKSAGVANEASRADHVHAPDSSRAALVHTHAISDITGLQLALDAKAPATSPTFTGTVTLPAATAHTNPGITNFTETRHAPAAGSSFTVDLANGTIQRFTTNANTTITLPSSVSGKSYVIEVAYGGVHTVTWAGGGTLKWAGGAAPTATSVNGKIDRYVFSCDGTNTLGSDGGRNF